jgi:hypothetical protein
MEDERFELHNFATPLGWQFPAPNCCKLQGKQTKQQLQKISSQNGEKIKKQLRTPDKMVCCA